MTAVFRGIFIFTALVATLLTAQSIPTMYGDTGLILVPTADVIPVMNIDVSAHYTTLGGGANMVQGIPISAVYGIADNTELFCTYMTTLQTSSQSFDFIDGGVKLALTRESLSQGRPGVAVGTRIFSVRPPNMDPTSGAEIYAVVSKALLSDGDMIDTGYVFRVHGGLSFTRYSGFMSGQFISPFLGFNFRHSNGNAAVIDIVPKQTSNGLTFRNTTISGSIRRPMSENFTLELGMTTPYGGVLNLGGGATLYIGINWHYEEQNTQETHHRPLIY